MTGRGRGRYRASDESDHEDLPSEKGIGEAGRSSDSDQPLSFHPGFAAWTAVLLIFFAGILLAPVVYRLYDTDASDPVDRMAILTSLALLVVGVIVLLSGVYIALLEVRGRFHIGAAGGEEAARNVSLRGTIRQFRSLVVVLVLAGCVPLVAAAWVAQSGVDSHSEASPAPTARTRTPSPAPSGTTTTPTP